jgi:hypothetical protein
VAAESRPQGPSALMRLRMTEMDIYVSPSPGCDAGWSAPEIIRTLWEIQTEEQGTANQLVDPQL